MSVLTKSNIVSILKDVEKRIAPTRVNKTIVDSFLMFVKDFPVNEKMTLEQTNDKIVELFLRKMKTNLTEKEVDIKEMLKHEISKKGDNPVLMLEKPALKNAQAATTQVATKQGVTTSTSVTMEPNAYHELMRTYGRENIIRNSHLLFDSFNRDRSDTRSDRFVFHFENSYSKRDGTVNALGQIRDIIELEIYPFEIQNAPTINNFYNKITMLVGEFKQGFIGPEEFHFMFNVTTLNNNTVRLTPINPIYKLRDPIFKLDNLTLIFKAPFTPVVMRPDVIFATITYSNNPIFTTTEPHYLETGDLVYFTDFNTANPSADRTIIAETNRIEGHTINRTGILEFTIPTLDFSTIALKITGYQPRILLGSKRSFIPMRVGYLLPQKDVTDF
jgi:hypothetical protein